MSLDEARLGEFIDAFADDFGAALHASTVVVGDKLGLYRALAELGPTDAATLAGEDWAERAPRSGVARRAVRLRLLPAQLADRLVLAEPRTSGRVSPTRPALSSWSEP